MRLKILSTVAASAMLAGTGQAFAEYPDKPITYIVPYSADPAATSARGPGSLHGKCLGGATMIVENHPAPAALSASPSSRRQRRDGYTLGNVTVPTSSRPASRRSSHTRNDSFS